jgi:hypothetical protein
MISAALTERPLADMKFHRVPKSSIQSNSSAAIATER